MDDGGTEAVDRKAGRPGGLSPTVGDSHHQSTENRRGSDGSARRKGVGRANPPARDRRRVIADVAVLAVEGAERMCWRRYPREVALSFIDGRVLCWLVRPEDEWPWIGDRTDASCRTNEPGRGADPATVAAELADAAEGYVICTEVPAYATWWLTALFTAGNRALPFAVLPLSQVISWTRLPPDTIQATQITIGDVCPAGPRSACNAVTDIETLRALSYHAAIPRIRAGHVAAGAEQMASTAEQPS